MKKLEDKQQKEAYPSFKNHINFAKISQPVERIYVEPLLEYAFVIDQENGLERGIYMP